VLGVEGLKELLEPVPYRGGRWGSGRNESGRSFQSLSLALGTISVLVRNTRQSEDRIWHK